MEPTYIKNSVIRSQFDRGHLKRRAPQPHIVASPFVIGLYLYDENAIFTNLIRTLFYRFVLKSKPILMLTFHPSTFRVRKHFASWTATAGNTVFRIIYTEGAYDVYLIDKNKAMYMGTTTKIYFPKINPLNISLDRNSQDTDEFFDVTSHALNSARSSMYSMESYATAHSHSS